MTQHEKALIAAANDLDEQDAGIYAGIRQPLPRAQRKELIPISGGAT